MLGWELPPHNAGGMGVVCYQMARALAGRGVAIDFVLPYTADHPDTVLLRHLCSDRDINITVLGAKILPYQAITLIKERSTNRP